MRTQETIDRVRQSVNEGANVLIRYRAQQLSLCASTLWKILCKDLHFHAYKIQLVQELKPRDHRTRRLFAEWAEGRIGMDPQFSSKILFSDEAHFWLNGYVNKQNCRIWSGDNPQAIEETLHPEKVTVWCT